ncbi:MAG: aspartyl protease family protein [Candidatus Aquilonibacter sp.]
MWQIVALLAALCDPRAALHEMYVATGGSAWAPVAEVSASGTAQTSGLRGTARFDDDLRGGRYARRFDIAVMGANADVFDGTADWVQDISGGVRRIDSPYARAEAITDAYLARRGYFDPRDEATLACVGDRAGETLIRVEPRGGIPAELAIDAQTHLLTSVSARAPLGIKVTRYADYRQVGDLVLPFSIRVGTRTSPDDDYAVAVTRYELAQRDNPADFSPPVQRNEGRIVGGDAATTVPLVLEGRQLLTWASIDGRAPMPFILDTGGHAILTTQAAAALGLRGSGGGESGGSGAGTITTQYTRVRSIRIGNAELLNQPMLIIPYGYSFYERGKRPPLAGIIGLEFFERFATQIDYGDRRITFTLLEAYRHRGGATRVGFTFERDPDLPMVTADADGHAGLFGVDTGNAGNLILYGRFLTRTGLLSQYSPGQKLIGQGTGGSNTAQLQTLRTFEIGGHLLHRVSASFTQMKSGAFAAWSQAGNLGLSVLSRFVPTFDYRTQSLYLDSERRATPLPKNGAGMSFTKDAPGAFTVLVVRAGSPAAAGGIVQGDQIVAVNGRSASEYSRADLVDLVTKPRGARLVLQVRRAGGEKDITIRW